MRMNKTLSLLFVIFLTQSFSVFNLNAATLSSKKWLEITRHFRMGIDQKWEIIPLTGVNGYISKPPTQDDQQVFIRVNEKMPRISLNDVLVKKWWEREIENAKQFGDESINLGCRKLNSPSVFLCERKVHSTVSNDYTVELVFWFPKEEAISIRFKSGQSFDEAVLLKKQINWKMR